MCACIFGAKPFSVRVKQARDVAPRVVSKVVGNVDESGRHRLSRLLSRVESGKPPEAHHASDVWHGGFSLCVRVELKMKS